jgi:hypothetical protein
MKKLGLVGALSLAMAAACGGDDTTGATSDDASLGGGSSTGGGAGANPTMTEVGGNTTGGATGGAGGEGTGGTGVGGTGGSGGAGGAGPTDSGVDAGIDALTVYSAAVTKPTGIALSATNVYWADEVSGVIATCPKSGCGANAPVPVVTTLAPRGIALRGTTLYWITAGTPDGSVVGTVKKCTLGSCAANQVIDLQMGRGYGPFGWVGIAADDKLVYVVGGPAAYTCPVNGCGDAAFGQLGALLNGPVFGVALDATTAYKTHAFGLLTTCPLSGCSSPEDEATIVNTTKTVAVAVDATNVYWSEFDFFSSTAYDGAIRTCPKSGCDVSAAKVLAGGSIIPYAMAVDDADLYFTDYRNGRVERIVKTQAKGTCVSNHLGGCEACVGEVLCTGMCSATCNEAGTD